MNKLSEAADKVREISGKAKSATAEAERLAGEAREAANKARAAAGKAKAAAAKAAEWTAAAMAWLRRAATFATRDVWDVEVSALRGLHRFLVRFVRTVYLVARGFKRNEVALRASSLTFVTMLSIVPVLALALSLAKVATDGDSLRHYVKKQVHELVFASAALPMPEIPGAPAADATAEDTEAPAAEGETEEHGEDGDNHAEDAELKSHAENSLTGEAATDGATATDEASVILERGFTTRAPFPRSFYGSYLITRVYDGNSDKLLYALTPGDDGFCLDEMLALAPKFTTIADTISFVDENTSEKDSNLVVNLQFEFVRKESRRNPPPPQVQLFRGERFIQVLTQNDWDELKQARQSGSLKRFAKERPIGKQKNIQKSDFLLQSEREQLSALLKDPTKTLTPSCRTRIEDFLRYYGEFDDAESDASARSADQPAAAGAAEPAPSAPEEC